jgi:hypothetical protein
VAAQVERVHVLRMVLAETRVLAGGAGAAEAYQEAAAGEGREVELLERKSSYGATEERSLLTVRPPSPISTPSSSWLTFL